MSWGDGTRTSSRVHVAGTVTECWDAWQVHRLNGGASNKSRVHVDGTVNECRYKYQVQDTLRRYSK